MKKITSIKQIRKRSINVLKGVCIIVKYSFVILTKYNQVHIKLGLCVVTFFLLFKRIGRIGFTNPKSTLGTEAINAEMGGNWGLALE